MPFFQSKQTISLSEESTRPSLKRSRWSFPCCGPVSFLTSQEGVIQLPDDSDSEDQPTPVPSSTGYQGLSAPSTTTSTTTTNVFLQHQNHLSRNPFARAPSRSEEDEPRVSQEPNETFVTETVLEEEQDEQEEELADISTFDASKYEDQPDWTEVNEEEESLVVDTLPTSSDTPPKKVVEEKVPQIEVLHHLPLTRLSKEIPPALIHEHHPPSMYGEQPVLSPSSNKITTESTESEPVDRSNNRFSMPQEVLEQERQSSLDLEGSSDDPLSAHSNDQHTSPF
ncbi:hypothetical protein BD560DRAFT_394374 [Blakeslea trispora]|nr:hypothetical protein BD560DRAFT_394374 [Blakeslea trispora]